MVQIMSSCCNYFTKSRSIHLLRLMQNTSLRHHRTCSVIVTPKSIWNFQKKKKTFVRNAKLQNRRQHTELRVRAVLFLYKYVNMNTTRTRKSTYIRDKKKTSVLTCSHIFKINITYQRSGVHSLLYSLWDIVYKW